MHILRLMQNETLQTGKNVQKTDENYYLEKAISGVFVTQQPTYFATVSTTIMIVHKSGLCLLEEYTYRHTATWLSYLFGRCMKKTWSVGRHEKFKFNLDLERVQEFSAASVEPSADEGPTEKSQLLVNQ